MEMQPTNKVFRLKGQKLHIKNVQMQIPTIVITKYMYYLHVALFLQSGDWGQKPKVWFWHNLLILPTLSSSSKTLLQFVLPNWRGQTSVD